MRDIDWSYIDKFIYINLTERKDRNLQTLQELAALNVPEEKVCRFDARKHLSGRIGCAMSHRDAVKIAIENKWKNVIILEDDNVFDKSEANKKAIKKLIDYLKQVKWDVTLLSAVYWDNGIKRLEGINNVIRPYFATCTNAYMINENYLQIMYDHYSDTVIKLLQGGVKEAYALDIHWMKLMQKDRWLGLYPVIGHQNAGNSDIWKGKVDFKNLFYKKLDVITMKT